MKLKKEITRLLNKPVEEFEKFHHHTKIVSFKTLPSKIWPSQWEKIYTKGYPRLREIILPPPKINSKSLKYAITHRKSSHEFPKSKLSLPKLSTILSYAAGLRDRPLGVSSHRTYPSAGARYPIEIYIVTLRTSLENGAYHYYFKNHSLEQLTNKSIILSTLLFTQAFTLTGSPRCLIILTGIFKRNTIKYGDVGYRYTLLEAGHICQNIYLLASILNIPCCSIGGFKDNSINSLLDIDGTIESPICTVLL